MTSNARIYHALNILWGVTPVLLDRDVLTMEESVALAESTLLRRGLARPGETILVAAGFLSDVKGGANFLKLHRVAGAARKP